MNKYEILNHFQTHMKAPKQKEGSARFASRNISQICESFHTVKMSGNDEQKKCCLILSDDIVWHEGKVIMKGIATFVTGEGEAVESHSYAEVDYKFKGMQVPQLYGACSSYARKYAAQGLFALTDNELDFDSFLLEEQANYAEKFIKSNYTNKEKPVPQFIKEKFIDLKNCKEIQVAIELVNEIVSYSEK